MRGGGREICMNEERSAGAVVFRDTEGEKKFLLLLYPAGHWDFPKGNIEKGEEPIDAAKREIEEETGIKEIHFVEGFQSKISYFYRRSDGLTHKEVIFFGARTGDESVKVSHEHVGFKWLNYSEALKRLTFENARKVLTELNEFLGKKGGQLTLNAR
jgi:bis(5'-nucleosidyl)-tetraphosphatase